MNNTKEFCARWEQTDHAGKLELCQEFGIGYDTGRHKYSDAPAEFKSQPRMQISENELLIMEPSVHLDFIMFDLETSGFDADWDIMLTACIKPYGRDTMVFRADDYPEWTANRANDRGIVVDIANEIRKHAVVVGHYSERFDVKFLRAKMFRHGLEPLPPMFGIDTWRIAKNNFKVSNRRMKSLSVFAEIPMEKEEPDGTRWMRASFGGDKAAMDDIVLHNIRDVEILEKLACLSFPYLRSISKL